MDQMDNPRALVAFPQPAPRRTKIVLPDVGSAVPSVVYNSDKVSKRPGSQIKNITLHYGSKSTKRDKFFDKPEYDLAEIARAADTEAYLAQSFLRHYRLMQKNGWHLRGLNEKAVAYIRQRLTEFELATDKSMDGVVDSLARNLIRYCNAFIVLRRDRTKSSGKPVKKFGKMLEPIAGVFSADPTCMQVAQDGDGNIRWWRQFVDGRDEKLFNKDDVIHIHYDKKDGFIFGTPWVVPVLDDIRALRRIEELIELLINRHIFPLFHYKVGTKELPAQVFDNNISEVDLIKAAVETMPSEGAIVTSERHEIKAIGSEGKALDVKPYLDYFEARVFSGLNMSGIDMGRGDTANRATAQSMSQQLIDSCQDFQRELAKDITACLFRALLEEGGFPLTDNNKVYFEYPVIDQEARRQEENHIMLMYQGNLLTLTEARQRMGRQPLTVSEMKDLHMSHIQIPLAIISASDESYQNPPSKSSGGSTSAKKPQPKKVMSPIKKKVIAANMPENQYGKKPGRGPTQNDESDVVYAPELSDYIPEVMDRYFNPINSEPEEPITLADSEGGEAMARKPVNDVIVALLQSFAEPWAKAQKELSDSIIAQGYSDETASQLLDTAIQDFVQIARQKATGWIQLGMDAFAEEVKMDKAKFFVGENFKRRFFDIMFKRHLETPFKLIKDRIKTRKWENIPRDIEVLSVMDSLFSRVGNALTGMEQAARNFGYTRAAMVSDLRHVYWRLTDNACDKCWDRAIGPVMIQGMSYEQFIPDHPECISGMTIQHPYQAQKDFDQSFWNTNTPAIRIDHVGFDYINRSAKVSMLMRNLTKDDIDGEKYKIGFKLDTGKSHYFVNGRENRVMRGKSVSDEAVWVSPWLFQLHDVPEGAHKLEIWLEDSKGPVVDPLDFPGVTKHNFKFVISTDHGQHDEWSSGSHRHDADEEPSGEHMHPHPVGNPLGLHQHDGQSEPSGAHIHDYHNTDGVHDYETHDPEEVLMESLAELPLSSFLKDSPECELCSADAMLSVLDSMLENDYFSFDSEGQYSRESIDQFREELCKLTDAKLSTGQRKKLKTSTFCGPNRSFPVPDCAHVTAARRLIGRYKGPGSKSKILACVSRKAKSLGCDSKK